MSHFLVLAIGDYPEEQLEEYWEISTPQEDAQYITSAQFSKELKEDEAQNYLTETIKHYNRQILESKDNSEIEHLEKSVKKMQKINKNDGWQVMEWVKEYTGWIIFEGYYGYWHNPNAKWDWYSIGGRWNGYLLLKNGKRANYAMKKDINFKQMKEDKFINGELAWKQFLRSNSLMKEGYKNGTPFFPANPDMHKREFTASYGSIAPYAVLLEDEWISKGELGWWAIEKATYENYCQWQNHFDDILNKIGDEEIITVIDCHI